MKTRLLAAGAAFVAAWCALSPAGFVRSASAQAPLAGDSFLVDRMVLPGDHALLILGDANVRRELKLIEDDWANLSLFKRELADGDVKTRAALRRAKPEERPALLHARRRAVDALLDGTLGVDRGRRLQQLQRQANGLHASWLSDPAVQEKLALEETQRARWMSASESPLPLPPPLGAVPSDPAAIVAMIEKQMADLRRRRDDAVLALLSADQKKAWSELIGKETGFPLPEPRAAVGMLAPPDLRGGLPPLLAGAAHAELLGGAEVRRELIAAGAVAAKLEELSASLRDGDEKFRGDHVGGRLEEVAALMRERQREVETSLRAALPAAAMTRLLQLRRQATGLLGCLQLDDEVVGKLKFKSSQRAEIGDLMRRGELPPPPSPQASAADPEKAFREY
ncbi:MAG TPA: hypothetical protein VNC50_09990, partial [Planctomycetia bacterium]|nr:hypothetical protein [Planctomycetia bacterium]